MASLEIVVEQLKANGEKNTAQLSSLNSSVLNMNSMLGDLTDALMMQRLDMLEMMREKKDTAPGAPAGQAGDAKAGSGNLALLLAGLAAFASGFIGGLLDSIKSLAKLFQIDRLFNAIKDATGRLLTRIGNIVSRIIDPIADVFRLMRTKVAEAVQDSIKIIDDMIQPIRNLFAAGPESRIGKLFSAIMKPFTFPFEGAIDELSKPLKALFSGEEGIISKIFRRIKTTFDALVEPIQKAFGLVTDAFKIFQEGSTLMNTLGTVGRVIGRLFYPFTLIMGIFDTVKGAIAGYEEGGFLGGIQGAIEGFFNSIVGAPLDLLKSGVEFILSKFGFEGAADALSGFSFENLITDIVFSPIEILKRAVNSLIEGIASLIEDVPLMGNVAAKLREFKFGEGMTRSEERAAVEAENARMEDAVASANLVSSDPSLSAAVKAQTIEEESAALRTSQAQNNIVMDNSSNVSQSSSSTQPILTTTPSARDYSDPMLAGA